jgi:hypothetical protein
MWFNFENIANGSANKIDKKMINIVINKAESSKLAWP